GGGRRRTGNRIGWTPHRCVPPRRRAHSRVAARRPPADEDGGIFARDADRGGNRARLKQPAMPRYKLTIEYDGTPFVGWQLQHGGPSVQGVIAAAIAAFADEQVAVHGAGRTDAGVHALGQVAHVDLSRDWRADQARDALNAHLRPHPVAVL